MFVHEEIIFDQSPLLLNFNLKKATLFLFFFKAINLLISNMFSLFIKESACIKNNHVELLFFAPPLSCLPLDADISTNFRSSLLIQFFVLSSDPPSTIIILPVLKYLEFLCINLILVSSLSVGIIKVTFIYVKAKTNVIKKPKKLL